MITGAMYTLTSGMMDFTAKPYGAAAKTAASPPSHASTLQSSHL
ncbi:MAG: hypothetical protein WAK48_30000 [Candidatus Acidiferrum sp.]|jgi:hypothetical protein